MVLYFLSMALFWGAHHTTPHSLWDLISPTREMPPVVEVQSSKHWTARKFPMAQNYYFIRKRHVIILWPFLLPAMWGFQQCYIGTWICGLGEWILNCSLLSSSLQKRYFCKWRTKARFNFLNQFCFLQVLI